MRVAVGAHDDEIGTEGGGTGQQEATRVLAAIPLLLVLSIVTFGIIKAQPGDYGDYLKSMLMSQKQGLRLADDCQAASQVEFSEEMKKNPPKSLFEGADAPPAAKK